MQTLEFTHPRTKMDELNQIQDDFKNILNLLENLTS